MKISKIISDFLKKIVIYLVIYLHIFSIQFYSFASAENISPSTLPTAGIVKSGSADISQNNSIINLKRERGVDVNVNRLRKKIEKNPKFPRYVKTIRGVGYMLIPDWK